jgi:hypothetical protein
MIEKVISDFIIFSIRFPLHMIVMVLSLLKQAAMLLAVHAVAMQKNADDDHKKTDNSLSARKRSGKERHLANDRKQYNPNLVETD